MSILTFILLLLHGLLFLNEEFINLNSEEQKNMNRIIIEDLNES